MTYGLVGINVLVYLYAQTEGVGVVFRRWGLWAKFDPATLSPSDLLVAGDEWWRWVSSGFVHGGILHIGLNMLVLYTFGTQLEALLGRARFTLIYALSLLGASAFVETFGDPNTVTGGASGAIYGLVAAFVAISLSLRLPVQSLVLQAGAWLVAGFIIPGLSWQGHLGGAVAGGLVTALMLRLVHRDEGRRARRA
jgi:membrane associated rhomboid family serine protease